MRVRRSALPIVAVVMSLASVGIVWFGHLRGGPDADQVRSGEGPVTSSPLVRGTELALPSPIAPLTSGSGTPQPEAPPAPVADDGRAGPVAAPALVADAVGRRVPVYAQPGDAQPLRWLDNPTWEALDVVFLVHEQRDDWFKVQVSMRPNGALAWVKAADVRVRPVEYQIVVDATNLRLVLYRDRKPVFEAPVAVGKGSTPTPIGNFFVDGIVALADKTGPYGSHQVSVAAFSDVYTSFAGGIGQIALHGTNQPNLLGTPVSNGCVRLANADIARLASLVPTGTPVQIVA